MLHMFIFSFPVGCTPSFDVQGAGSGDPSISTVMATSSTAPDASPQTVLLPVAANSSSVGTATKKGAGADAGSSAKKSGEKPKPEPKPQV